MSAKDQNRVDEYVALFHGRPRLQQLEMALALSERVLSGKDQASDRQIQAAAANQMWRELGTIDWAQIDATAASRSGWQRVASLGIQEEFERLAFVDLVRSTMRGICQDDPIDVEVTNGAMVRVYRFRAGQRTLIDRRGGRRFSGGVDRIHPAAATGSTLGSKSRPGDRDEVDPRRSQ